MKKLPIFLLCAGMIVAIPLFLSGCKDKTDSGTTSVQAPQNRADAMAQNAVAAADAAIEQTICPVMKNNPVDKDIYVEYQGKKVYFCCEDCKEVFAKNPEKYIKDLPQFN
jgi:YHS domain-containing protein